MTTITELQNELPQTEQMNMNKGLKVFKEEGEKAVTSELKQLHDMEALKPVMPTDLTEKQRKGALSYLMYLKRKRNGKVKARGCADGRKQRVYMTKDETSSPTVSLCLL
jgi:hypothetical protein